MKKRLMRLMLVALLVLGMTVAFATQSFASSGIKVFVDGELIVFDVEPQAINGRTMVPMRKIFEALDADVQWISETNSIVSTKFVDGEILTVEMTLGQQFMYVSGVQKDCGVAPAVIDGRTLVPVRAVSEALGVEVEWVGDISVVDIKTDKYYEEVEIVDYRDANNNVKQVPEHLVEFYMEIDAQVTVVTPAPAPQPAVRQNYQGTKVPTYTSVTGVSLKGQDTVEGSPLYEYDYTNAEDVGEYWDALIDAGFERIESDDSTTAEVFESAFLKDETIVIVNVYFDSYEVWVYIVEMDDSASSSSGSSSNYYQGTKVPTYTSVTGIRVKDVETLSGGDPLYTYEFTSTDDVAQYWEALLQNGWTIIGEDDESTTDMFESGFAKDGELVVICIVNVAGSGEFEVWITCNDI